MLKSNINAITWTPYTRRKVKKKKKDQRNASFYQFDSISNKQHKVGDSKGGIKQ